MASSDNGREQFRQQVEAARRSFASYERPKQEFLRREVVTGTQNQSSGRNK